MRRGRPLTSQTAFGGQLPYKGSLVRPAVRFDHNPFEYNVDFYELRITNPALFLDSDAASAATNAGLYYDHMLPVMNSGYAQDSRGLFGPSGADQRKAQDGCQNGQQRLDALVRRPLRYRIQAIKINADRSSQVAGRRGLLARKNCTANGLCA